MCCEPLLPVCVHMLWFINRRCINFDVLSQPISELGEIEQKLLPKPRDPAIPCGLMNRGMSCYANVIIQILFHIAPLRRHMYVPLFILIHLACPLTSEKG